MVDQLQHATEALRKALAQVERLKRSNRALLERSSEPDRDRRDVLPLPGRGR